MGFGTPMYTGKTAPPVPFAYTVYTLKFLQFFLHHAPFSEDKLRIQIFDSQVFIKPESLIFQNKKHI